MSKLIKYIHVLTWIIAQLLISNCQQSYHDQIWQIQQQYQEDAFSHPGTTFEKLNCSQYNFKWKEIAITQPDNFTIIYDYFRTRCDMSLNWLGRLNTSEYLKETAIDYMKKMYFFNPKQPQEWVNHYFIEGQKIYNHIPGLLETFNDKVSLINTLQEFDAKKLFTFSSSDFYLESQSFEIQTNKFSESESKFFQNQNDGYWVQKDPKGIDGSGIRVFRNKEAFMNEIQTLKQSSAKVKQTEYWKSQNLHYAYLQRYLEKPFLINGFQAEHERLVLIASVKPLVILVQPGTTKTCSEKYELNFENFGVKEGLQNINNLNTQSRNPDYFQNIQQYAWTPQRFYDYLEKEKGLTKDQIQQFNLQVNKIIVYSILAAKPKLTLQRGFFQLFTADFLMDEDLQPYLLEFNTTNVYFKKEKYQQYTYPQFIQSTYDMIIQTHRNSSKLWEMWQNPQQNVDLGRFEILYNEASGQSILDPFIITKEKWVETDL